MKTKINILLTILISVLIVNAQADKEITDLLPKGYHTIHKIVAGDFGGSNSGGKNEPSADSRKKFVLLYSNKTPADKYKIKVVVPAGFEAFDSYDLPDPGYTWSIMKPLAVFFDNVDNDKENELLILEQCMTGIGPDGAKYFYRTRVYDWDGKNFRHFETVSEKIGNEDTAAGVRTKLPGIIKSLAAETIADLQKVDYSGFNQKIEKAAAAREDWVKRPTEIVGRMIGAFSEIRSRIIEMKAPAAEGTDSLTVTVIDDGFLDDSVRGEKLLFELRADDEGVWKFVSASKTWRCWPGRGHEDFSAVKCL